MRRAAHVLAAWSPALVVAALSCWFYVDAPYFDIWDWLERHYPLTSQAGLLERYWRPFNDSRVLIALLIDRAMLAPTQMSMVVRAFLKLPVALLTALLLVRLARRTFICPPGALVTFVLVAAAFPLASWPMWMDPRSFAGHTSVLLVISAISAASGPVSARAFWTTCAWGVAASLTYIHGSLAWPALFAGLWLAGQGTRAAWCVAPAAAAVLEITRVVDVVRLGPGVSAPSWPGASLADMAWVALGMLGAPLAYGRTDVATTGAVAVGALGLAAAIVAGVAVMPDADRRRRALPWLMIATWALTNVAAMAAGRARLGVSAVFTERYVPVTAMFWGALVTLVWLLAGTWRGDAGRMRLARRWLVATGLALLCSWGLASWDAIAGTRLTALASRLSVGRTCIGAWPDVDDECLTLLFPDAPRARAILTRIAPFDPSFLRPEGRTPMPVHLRRVPTPLSWSSVHLESAVPGGTLVDVLDVDGEAWGPVILQHPPSTLFWDVPVPDSPQARIESGVRVNVPAWPGRSLSDGVLFEVRVSAGGESTTIWRRLVPPARPHQGFLPVSVDLSRWRGRTVQLWLVTAPGESPRATNAFDWAVWLYPSFIQLGSS